MGKEEAMMGRVAVLLVGVAICLVAQTSAEEVVSMEAITSGHDLSESADDVDDLLESTEALLGEHEELMSQLKHAPSAQVLSLTHKIKALQSDIKGIRTKKAQLHSQSAASKERAHHTKGGSKVSHMKKHIDAGARAHDLDAQLKSKNHQLASLTIKQHDAASGGANQGTMPSADSGAGADVPVDTTGGG